MSKFKVGDKVLVKKPINAEVEGWYSYSMDGFDNKIHTICGALNDWFTTEEAGGPNGYCFNPKWLTKVNICPKSGCVYQVNDPPSPDLSTDSEMTWERWDKMSIKEKCEWNQPAYEALGDGEEIEWLADKTTGWVSTRSVSISAPHRPIIKTPVVRPEYPKEIWMIGFNDGSVSDERYLTEDAAQLNIVSYKDGYEPEPVRYVRADEE